MSKKVKVRVKKPHWSEAWVKERALELFTFYRDMVITLHPVHGIVGVACSLENAMIQAQYLRRKVAAECCHVDMNQMLAKVRPGLQVIPRPDSPNMDPYRQEAEEPVPEKHEPPPHLTDPFDNADVILDGSQPPPVDNDPSDVGTFNPKPEEKATPFPSPDKQPPFMPRRSPLEGSVRLDGVSNPGARGSWGRGLRYD